MYAQSAFVLRNSNVQGRTSMQDRAASRWALDLLHRVLPSSSSSTSIPGLLSLLASSSSVALPLPFLSCQKTPDLSIAL